MVRIAVVRQEDCNPQACGNFLCIKLCPVNRTGGECITHSEKQKAKIDESLCTGCGICPNRCPFDAIDIINLPEELKEPPVHQYGRNGFHLFRLPAPIFGKVVGLLGVNGIGKSTAFKILARMLQPNFGQYSEGALSKDESDNELLERFKGTESQTFFEKVIKGGIKVAFKPQMVEEIPRTFEGTVRALLEKVNERDPSRFDEIIELLNLKKFLDNDIKKISGGELQRVAIAATVLKDANLFIFDEPTSYLDIKQRMLVSRFISSLTKDGEGNERKDVAVLVIEHDLIVLDYMADLVQLMYGKAGAYGVVAQPKNTKVAINEFIAGYMREENIRFRDTELKFWGQGYISDRDFGDLCAWTAIEKNWPAFSLKANPGLIKKRKVIGILGENGIGKTTFVKILAGVEKADSGEIKNKMKVSYKPQVIAASDDIVSALFDPEKLEKYKATIVQPLRLEKLMLKQLDQLSGGELQRVAIAKCLLEEADLYLLDEPSAYLDVEQRLQVSRIVRDVMEQREKSALVVDHDLLFIDILSKELIVFEGVPAQNGALFGPFEMQEGMNRFLQDLGMTFRRDDETRRPRANKEDSQMDRKQKTDGVLYKV